MMSLFERIKKELKIEMEKNKDNRAIIDLWFDELSNEELNELENETLEIISNEPGYCILISYRDKTKQSGVTILYIEEIRQRELRNLEEWGFILMDKDYSDIKTKIGEWRRNDV